MKLFLALLLFCLLSLSHHARGDLLDDLDDHHDHDDHHEDHHEDHFDPDDDDDDDDHHSPLAKELLREIEQFLPNKESGSFVSANTVGGASGAQFGIPLVPVETPRVPQNQNSQKFGVPLVSEPIGNNVQDPPQRSFVNAPQQPAVTSRVQSRGRPTPTVREPVVSNQVLNQPIEQTVPVAFLDSDEDFLDVDIPDSISSASLGFDSTHEDYDDIQANRIGGQGRQLDAGTPGGRSDFLLNPFEGNYPRFDLVPRTSFSCEQQQFGGYFADPEADCQVFHICLDGGNMGSFLCPNGTLFNQELFVCDWWFNVDCSLAPQNYQLNSRIGVTLDSDEEDFS